MTSDVYPTISVNTSKIFELIIPDLKTNLLQLDQDNFFKSAFLTNS